MGLFFDASNADEAFQELAEIRNWCHQLEFGYLLKWHRNIRRGFGYKNMKYLKLKIMQQCGFLNSTYLNKNGDMVKL